MKNFIIGLMLGIWVGPIGKEVARHMVEKIEVDTRPQGDVK
jgi:hypothetical protein